MNQRRQRCVRWKQKRRELRTTCLRVERNPKIENQIVSLLALRQSTTLTYVEKEKVFGHLGYVVHWCS